MHNPWPHQKPSAEQATRQGISPHTQVGDHVGEAQGRGRRQLLTGESGPDGSDHRISSVGQCVNRRVEIVIRLPG